MKYLILADVHGNLEALIAVLKDTKGMGLNFSPNLKRVLQELDGEPICGMDAQLGPRDYGKTPDTPFIHGLETPPINFDFLSSIPTTQKKACWLNLVLNMMVWFV